METRRQYKKALVFWKLSLEYLSLVENVSHEIAVNGNKWVIISDVPPNENEYAEKTKWSDFNIITPVLFDLYQGIELLVKGYLIMKGYEEPIHDIKTLCQKFKEYYPDETELNDFFSKYSDESNLPSILVEFLTKNCLRFKNLYEALRYPSDTTFRSLRTYDGLKYTGEGGLSFFQELQDDIGAIRKPAVKLGRSFEN